VAYFIEKMNGRSYIVGYSLPTNLDPLLQEEKTWRDDFGNPRWELLEDGSVVPASIQPKSEDIQDRDEKILDKKVQERAGFILRVLAKEDTVGGVMTALKDAVKDILDG